MQCVAIVSKAARRACAPCAAARVSYPFKDAGVQDTVQLVSDASFRPQPNSWLAGPVATLFGTGQNATAVLLQINVPIPSIAAWSCCMLCSCSLAYCSSSSTAVLLHAVLINIPKFFISHNPCCMCS